MCIYSSPCSSRQCILFFLESMHFTTSLNDLSKTSVLFVMQYFLLTPIFISIFSKALNSFSLLLFVTFKHFVFSSCVHNFFIDSSIFYMHKLERNIFCFNQFKKVTYYLSSITCQTTRFHFIICYQLQYLFNIHICFFIILLNFYYYF